MPRRRGPHVGPCDRRRVVTCGSAPASARSNCSQATPKPVVREPGSRSR